MPTGIFPRITAKDRFEDKVVKVDGGCWEWLASKDNLGYGMFWYEGRLVCAHIVSYEWLNGKVPEGLELDHLCRNHSCVNPHHLEAVTHLENTRRGVAAEVNGQRQLAITHCPQRHPYDLLNTYITLDGKRVCRTCQKLAKKKHRKKKATLALLEAVYKLIEEEK